MTVSAFSLVIPVQLNTGIIIVILFLYFVEQINVMMIWIMMTTAKLHINTFVDDVAFEPTYLQALLTAAGLQVHVYVTVGA